MKFALEELLMSSGVVRVLILTSCFYKSIKIMSASEELFFQLKKDKYFQLWCSSSEQNKIFKFFDYISIFLKHGKSASVSIVDINSGRQFLWAIQNVLLSKLFGLRILAVIHGGGFIEMHKKHSRLVNILLQLTDVISSPSKIISEYINKNFTKRCHELPNGIDCKQYAITRERHTPDFLYVRGYHDIYNPMMALKAFRIISNEIPHARLNMYGVIGSQSCYIECSNYIQKNSLSRNVQIHGPIDKILMPNIMKKSSFLLNTTNYESFGISLMEAAAASMCSISTSVGEIPLLWEDGKNISLVERNDHNAMAALAIALFNNQDSASEMAFKAKKKAKNYDWTFVLSRYKKLIEKTNEI
jgi:glycosyltransferase involved in cell wall biosynthesis